MVGKRVWFLLKQYIYRPSPYCPGCSMDKITERPCSSRNRKEDKRKKETVRRKMKTANGRKKKTANGWKEDMWMRRML